MNPTKVAVNAPAFDESIYKDLQAKYGEKLRDALDTAKHPKTESYALVDEIKKEIYAAIPETED